MAILTSLKMISLVNSFLLGSLLLKFKWAQAQALENELHGNGAHGHGNAGGHGTTAGGGPIIHGGTGVLGGNGIVHGGVSNPLLGNRIELGYEKNARRRKKTCFESN